MDKNKDNKRSNYIFTRETFGMTILLFSALVAIMLFTGDLVFAGIGKSVCNFLYGIFGYGIYLVVAAFVYLGVWLTFEKAVRIPLRTFASVAMTVFMIATLVQSVMTSGYAIDDLGQFLSTCYQNASQGFAGYTAGGVICSLLVYPVATATTFVGCYLVFSILIVLFGYLSYMAIKKDFFSAMTTQNEVQVQQVEVDEETEEEIEQEQVQDIVAEPVETVNEDNNKFSKENLGRKILFDNDEFAAESYKRNMIFNSDSYFNNPVHNEGDYLKSFGDANGGYGDRSYTENYAEQKSAYPSTNSYTTGDAPVSDFGDVNAPANIDSFSEPDYNIEEIIGASQKPTYIEPVEDKEVEFEPIQEPYADFEEPEAIEGNYVMPEETPAQVPTEEPEQEKPQSFSPFGSIFNASNTRVGNSVQPDVSRLSSRRGQQSNANLFDEEENIFGDDIAPLGAGFRDDSSIGRVDRAPVELPNERNRVVGFDTTQSAPETPRIENVDLRRESQAVHITPPTKQTIEEENVAKPEKPKHVWQKYVRPTLDLLDDYPESNNVNTGEIEDNKRIIVETLETSKIRSHISNVVVGPAVTRYDVIIEDKTQIKNALKYKDTVAISLMKENVNAYLNYSKGAISFEIPNAKRTVVGLKTILASSTFINAKAGQLAFALGKNIEGECICEDITKMPHLLVAGTTGSGKSICLSSLVISLLYKYGPEELRFILVDPKQSEFVVYDKLPHLMINEIIYDIDKAIKALNWAIKEMERRYELFKIMTEAGTVTKNLEEYNSHLAEGEEKLPKIVIILDEFGDLMLQAKKDIETRIIRLVQKARACGIHLILATQRPSVDCITGLIKSNLPTRIGFKVNSFDDARTIFDIGGAEKLLGKGDMFYRSASKPDLSRIQGCFVDSPEVQRVIAFIKQNNETYFDDEVSEFINKVEEPESSVGDDVPIDTDTKIDEVFIKALKKCVFSSAGNASVSMIQRYFPVGYIKACKIIDWMDNMGYITQSEGSKPRKVLLSREEFLNIYGDVDD